MTQEASIWRVSSYTGGTGNCVEVGQSTAAVLIRDTKRREAGSISVSLSTWQDFLEAVR